MRAVFALFFFLSGLTSSSACHLDQLEIITQTGSHRFTVEIADNVLSRARGLMHRPTLPSGKGMLFLYDSETPVAFWMKDVAFPLDMIFINRSGRVVRIHENAEPGDLTPIYSVEPVLAVLEIPGGASKRAQITTGDKVRNAVLKDRDTPCR